MNDFTKDELRHIGDAILYGMAALPERKEALMLIRGKVLNMIEDDCQHTLTLTDTFTKCAHCNQILGY